MDCGSLMEASAWAFCSWIQAGPAGQAKAETWKSRISKRTLQRILALLIV